MNSLLLCILISALTNLEDMKITVVGSSPNDDELGEPISEEEINECENLVEDPLDPDQNPIELAGLYEGDISLGNSRNAIKGDSLKWPNAEIPYVISSKFSKQERLVIAKAFKNFREKTCIRLKHRTIESDYVYFKKFEGCWSYVGKKGGEQPISLGIGCINTGTIIHEIMHAVGFWHEQSRYDRDAHVTINYDNIKENMTYNFNISTLEKASLLNAPYDYCSIMHYSAYAFSENGKPTIVKKKASSCTMGQQSKLSDIDMRKLNELYQCDGYPKTTFIEDCEDRTEQCEDLAAIGECENNADFMLDTCKLSCGVCKADPCANKKADCQERAIKGECENNSSFMLENCKLSCNTCMVKECENDNSYCDYWAMLGECEADPDYMLVKCKKACNVC